MALNILRKTDDDPLPGPLAGAVRRRGGITIRHGTPDDVAGVERLARLVDRRPPAGPVLVAEVDGVLLVALPLDGGDPVVDPFLVTGDLVELLGLRAGQLAAAA